MILPRDFAESSGIKEGSPVRLSLIGRQIVIEPDDDTASDEAFHRAYSAVVRRHSETFKFLAEYDEGKVK